MVTFCPVSVMRVTDCSEPNKKKDKTPSVKNTEGVLDVFIFKSFQKSLFAAENRSR